ncbi:MAG TPA: thioredoxin-dependent thiol peroxidase [Nitrososphaerales archaeon]|nr:thioredoxin-dependent thiol peroxidase [Nitrososphaerales archaeon]
MKQGHKELGVGDRAPDFELPSSSGKPVKLSSMKGKSVVLYFYPQDDTPGCTREACTFRDNLPKFGGLDAVILGVSKDSLESHAKFINKYSLNFTLLSDEDLVAHKLYDTWKEKNNYGRTYMGTERSTFIIDANGKIKKIFRRVKVDGHESEVLAALQA